MLEIPEKHIIYHLYCKKQIFSLCKQVTNNKMYIKYTLDKPDQFPGVYMFSVHDIKYYYDNRDKQNLKYLHKYSMIHSNKIEDKKYMSDNVSIF